MDSYTTVKESGESYFEDRRSKFIGFCRPVSTEDQAIEFINAVKKKYPDARHWVYAYVLRENNIMRYTDDREPQGTAGMPVLDAIRKNNCTDTVIVVVRYFGGTLLGTGGLVHAYSEAALAALRDAKIVVYNVYSTVSYKVSYSDYQKIGAILSELEFVDEDIEYSDEVFCVGTLPKNSFEKFKAQIVQATSGRAQIEYISEGFGYR